MRQATFKCQYLVFAFALAWLASASGCGQAPPKSELVASPSPSTDRPPQLSQADSADTAAEVTEFDGIDANPPLAQSGERQSPPETPRGDGTSSAESPAPLADAMDAAAAVVPIPSATQLDKWKLVEWEPWQLLARQSTKTLAFVSCATTSSDGKWLVLGGNKLALWKMGNETPEPIPFEPPTAPETYSITAIAVAPNNQWFATGDTNGNLKTWNLNTLKPIASKDIYGTAVVQIAISDDGQEIAATTYENEVSTWVAKSLEPKGKFVANGYTRLRYIGPEQLVVTGKTMEVWNPSSGQMIRTVLDKGYPKSIARSNDGGWYAVASNEALKLIASQDPNRTQSIPGNFATDELIEFSSDGRHLWTANGVVMRAWDIERGTMLQAIDAFGPAIVSIDFLPQEQLLRTVAEDGTIKFWGTSAAASASGMKPLHGPVSLPERAEPKIANSSQLLQAIDLRSFPRPPNSRASVTEATMAMFDTSESIDEVKSFYRYVLNRNDWAERPQNPLTPDYLNFEKAGIRLFISLFNSQPSVTSVQIANLGNADARTIPKWDATPPKIIFEDASSATYQIKTNLLTAEVDLLRKLSAAGWTPYSRLNASRSEEKDSRSLEFVQNACTLRVSLRPASEDPTNLLVQHTLFIAQSEVPVPDDCDYIECDVNNPPALVAFTSLGLDACEEFYQQAMHDLGWLAVGVTKNPQQNLRWLTYFQGQRELTLRLSTEADGRTCILTGENAVKNSWQLAALKSFGPTDLAADKNSSTEESKPGFEAADLEIYKATEAMSIKYQADSKQIEATVPRTSHIEIADFYATYFGKHGWTEEPNGIRGEDYTLVTFSRDKVSIEVRINSSASLNTTTFLLSDDGLLWTKPLPTPSEPTSYETWLRSKGHPATLRLLDSFAEEMEKLKKG